MNSKAEPGINPGTSWSVGSDCTTEPKILPDILPESIISLIKCTVFQ